MYQEDGGGFHIADHVDDDDDFSQQYYFPSTFDIHLPDQPQSNAMMPDLQYYESSSPPLNLKLSVTGDLVHEINQKLEPPTPTPTKADSVIDQDKYKACNFPATYAQIGHWNKTARHDMDIIIKFYFKKKKMALEALDGSLKTKLEVKFADISAIRFLNLNTPNQGVLEILLDGKPGFFRETDPKPKKHTVWVASHDFTNGQASFYRKQTLRFNPGSLEKLYKRIVAADSYLARLTSQPFPSDENPCFDQSNFTEISFRNPQNHTTTSTTDHQYSPAIPYNNWCHNVPSVQPPVVQTGYPIIQQTGYPINHLVDDQFAACSSTFIPQNQFYPSDYVDQSMAQTGVYDSYNFVEQTPDYHYSMATTTTTQEPIEYSTVPNHFPNDFSNYDVTSSSEYRLDQLSYFPSQFDSFQAPLRVAGVGIPYQGESTYWG
ncbi:hypothetical protein V2J09_001573 [Rumex salicifolius]